MKASVLAQIKQVLVIILLFCNSLLFAQNGKCISGNCITGFGKIVYQGVDSGRYEGQFVGGQRNGQGTYEDIWKIYTGEWKNDVYAGQGKLSMKITYSSKYKFSEQYTGNFQNGKYNGEGTWVYFVDSDSSLVYRGSFKDGQRFGKGTLQFSKMGSVSSDSWTANDSFSSGINTSEDKKTVLQGSYVNNSFEQKQRTASVPYTSGQGNLTTLYFHKSNAAILKQNVFQQDLVNTLASPKTGNITINRKSSELIISASGEPAKTYQIKSIGSEVKDKWDNKTITIECADASGSSCLAVIKKSYAFNSSNEMWLNITYPNGTGKGYLCDLIADLSGM